ncbi:MAG: 2'-5' RNA ligase family protein [Planctomycetota bacterium]
MHALVAFPVWDGNAAAFVESVRRRFDPQAPSIAAHFTLVFPTAIAVERWWPEVTAELRTVRRFPVALRDLHVEAPAAEGDCHLFLLPSMRSRDGVARSEGANELRALHEQLHSGVLRGELRADRPYLPHVTIGRFGDRVAASTCAAVVERELATAPGVALTGAVSAVQRVDVVDGRIELGARLDFAG